MRTSSGLINESGITDERNLGGKSDILRYEIVYQYGGIYTDTDTVSVSGFGAEFSTSLVSHSLDPWNNLNNAIFGFPAKSEFLKMLLLNLPVKKRLQTLAEEDISYKGYKLEYGPPLFTTVFVHFNDS